MLASLPMDDRRAAWLLSVLALTGAGVRYVLAPERGGILAVQLLAAVDRAAPSAASA